MRSISSLPRNVGHGSPISRIFVSISVACCHMISAHRMDDPYCFQRPRSGPIRLPCPDGVGGPRLLGRCGGRERGQPENQRHGYPAHARALLPGSGEEAIHLGSHSRVREIAVNGRDRVQDWFLTSAAATAGGNRRATGPRRRAALSLTRGLPVFTHCRRARRLKSNSLPVFAATPVCPHTASAVRRLLSQAEDSCARLPLARVVRLRSDSPRCLKLAAAASSNPRALGSAVSAASDLRRRSSVSSNRGVVKIEQTASAPVPIVYSHPGVCRCAAAVTRASDSC